MYYEESRNKKLLYIVPGECPGICKTLNVLSPRSNSKLKNVNKKYDYLSLNKKICHSLVLHISGAPRLWELKTQNSIFGNWYKCFNMITTTI